VVEQVLQRRRNAVVVFAADDDEAIAGADDRRQLRQRPRRGAFRVLLVHFVEQRQRVFQRIDKGGLVAAGAELRLNEARVLDALALAADRAVQDDEVHELLDRWEGAGRRC